MNETIIVMIVASTDMTSTFLYGLRECIKNHMVYINIEDDVFSLCPQYEGCECLNFFRN